MCRGHSAGPPVVELLAAEREPKGLLALMLLHDARRATRTDDDGAIVLLEDQDRSRWDREKIAEGAALVEQALRGRPLGPYAVQAAIAALHAQAPSARDTDWPQIAALYSVLAVLHPSPVVELNRAVAIAMADGFERGLALLDTIHLPGYHLLPAARGPSAPPGPSGRRGRSLSPGLGAGHQRGRAAIPRAAAG